MNITTKRVKKNYFCSVIAECNNQVKKNLVLIFFKADIIITSKPVLF